MQKTEKILLTCCDKQKKGHIKIPPVFSVFNNTFPPLAYIYAKADPGITDLRPLTVEGFCRGLGGMSQNACRKKSANTDNKKNTFFKSAPFFSHPSEIIESYVFIFNS